jgi:hypothetical protein
LREFEWSRLFTLSPQELGKSANQRTGARVMILSIEPYTIPSPNRSFQRKVEEASVRASLKTYALDNLLVSGTQLIFQEKVVLR